ncbi:MAG: ribosomal protein S18-alanine N-acetyltransferase [Dehalococcoidia bacterium]|nr:ribosomal protein S18-alanine N-acetyltransferase [Dehalococcoidia bacterium]
MELEDIPQVSEIEREAFPPPWPQTNFKRDLTVNTLTRYLVIFKESQEPGLQSAYPDVSNSSELSPISKLGSLMAAIGHFFNRKNGIKPARQLILGFAGLWFMADEAHLANIAVREAYRQRGAGELLLISIIELAIEQNARFITLEVRESNKAAQTLYQKYGFVDVGVRHSYYTDNKEDAILMTVEGVCKSSYREEFLEPKKRSHTLV